MLSSGFVVLVGGCYLTGLFVLAFFSDRRAERGAVRFVNSPAVYTLSLAVYCTSWTFYGAVGSAARNGLEFLTIYLGPTIVFMGWWFVLRKLVHISNAHRITSIADFISARYGKSAPISALVTLIAVIGITPYIALQLKAVSSSFDILVLPDVVEDGGNPLTAGLYTDTGFWVAMSMAVFATLFGTRNLSANEHHPGIVAAIAFESLVKLLSLTAIGLFALYGLHDGVADLFDGAVSDPRLAHLFTFGEDFEGRWATTLFLAGAAIICLPRQFQVAVIENADERHLDTASWLFPLYMLLISLFVMPIAVTGLTLLPADSDPDLYVLTIPLAGDQPVLALVAFIGGLSAATSMVIVSSIALSIMISNHLVAPILFRLPFFREPARGNFSSILLVVRRISIFAILTLGFVYYRLTTTGSPLASIGLISFAGVAQFLPALVGGIFWRRGTRHGALAGLLVGFIVWAYTLLTPNFGAAGWAFEGLVAHGPWGIDWLRPTQMLGLSGLDPLVHGVLWSQTANIVVFIVVSLSTRPSPLESLQGALFVNALQPNEGPAEGAVERSATDSDIMHLAQRILGPERAHQIFRDYSHRWARSGDLPAPQGALIAHVERELAGSVGAASARSLVSRIVHGERISVEAVIDILDRTQRAISTSQMLERRSRELQETAAQLRRANEQLTRMDRIKDDFLSQVSHELRTPMTSIRSFSEILIDDPPPTEEEKWRYLDIIRQESGRLTRLLDEILDLSRLENDFVEWTLTAVDCREVVEDAADTMRGLAQQHGVALTTAVGEQPAMVMVDRDRLKQVFVNLLSNAIQYNDRPQPKAWIAVQARGADRAEIRIGDNGPGIGEEDRQVIFAKFGRGSSTRTSKTAGSGLGLAISHQIVQRLGGELRLAETGPAGTVFVVDLPRAAAAAA
ncbi:MAG: hypothetical protein KDA64_03705 [Rhodospirillaceae bacterium]|nr:hypothetical protein [Rhodospirillaceae bacterium]